MLAVAIRTDSPWAKPAIPRCAAHLGVPEATWRQVLPRAGDFPLSHHYYSILFSRFLCSFLRAEFCFASLNPWWLVWYSVYSRCSINAFECMDKQMVVITLLKRLRAWNYLFKAITIIMGFILAWARKKAFDPEPWTFSSSVFTHQYPWM